MSRFIDKSILIPRDVIAWFSGQMERKLAENDSKPGWQGDYLTGLYVRLQEEASELDDILSKPSLFPGSQVDNYDNVQLEAIIRESADVANFAMMMADKARRELDERIRKAQDPNA